VNYAKGHVLGEMFRRFPVGFVAAFLQLLALALATPLVLAIMRHGSTVPLLTNFLPNFTAPSVETQSSIVTGTYLIVSLGVSLTENRFLDSTAMQIRHLSHLRRFHNADLAMALLLIQFCLGVVGFAMLALQPPQFLAALEHQDGWGEIALIGWPGIMSMGTAFFGANAHATLRALQW
jgi:hypothetical protein